MRIRENSRECSYTHVTAMYPRAVKRQIVTWILPLYIVFDFWTPRVYTYECFRFFSRYILRRAHAKINIERDGSLLKKKKKQVPTSLTFTLWHVSFLELCNYRHAWLSLMHIIYPLYPRVVLCVCVCVCILTKRTRERWQKKICFANNKNYNFKE